MQTKEWTFKSQDGLELYARYWAPDKKAKAVACLVHGLGEHIGRYAHVAKALTAAGYALAGFDLRGHGKSAGPRGHVPSYDAVMEDLHRFLEQVDGQFPGLPRFLYGHSLGSNIALYLSLRRKPDVLGVIATGPLLRMGFEPPAVKVALGRAMNSIYPGFTQPSGLEQAALSRDPAVVAAYAADPLVHDKISARLFVEMYEAGLYALEHAAEFPLPMLLMHGSADRLTSAPASKEFAGKAGPKVTFKMWEGWYHEIHNEPDQAQIFEKMISWMDEQLKKKK